MDSLVAAGPYFLEVALTLAALTLTALVLGRLLMGRMDEVVERWAIPSALGVAVLAHLGLLLGFAGLLEPLPVLLVLGAIHLLAFPVWRELLGAGGTLSALRRQPLPLLGALAALLPSVLLVLYPPTAFDATLYHLPFARGFALSGGLPWLPDLRFPIFPQANEMLFALVMLFAPDVAAHGVQWLMTMLAAALIWVWGRDAFGSAAAGGLAAAIFLGNPIVVHLATSGYVEAGLLLFSTAALYAVRRWRGTGARRWLVLAAVFAATAAATKYLGLFWLAAIGLVVLCGRLPTRPRRARWGGALVFALVAAAVVAPWYGRIYAATGNPVFPYFPGIFGDSAWAPFRFRGFLEAPAAAGGDPVAVATPAQVLGSRFVNLARLPWDVVFERGKYGAQPPYSPVYLALLPLALLAARRDPRQRRLLGLATVYAFVCLGLPGDSRYLIPAVPLVSLAAAGALLPLSGRVARQRFGIALLCAAGVLPGFAYSWVRLARQGPLPFTSEQREAHVSRRLPLYPAVAHLNRTLGDRYAAWAFHAENLAYYARGRWLGDWVGPASFGRVLAGVRDPQDLHRRLRALGADHLVVPGNVGPLPFPQDAAFEQWFEPIYVEPGARVFRLREAPRS